MALRFGERVYGVAAAALTEGGLGVTAAQLSALAADMKAPENREKYADLRGVHIGAMITSYKLPRRASQD